MRFILYVHASSIGMKGLISLKKFQQKIFSKNLLFNSMDYLIKCESILLATFIEKIWIIRQEALYANDGMNTTDFIMKLM